MDKLEFKPEDFNFDLKRLNSECAQAANTRLAEMLKDAKVVYGWIDSQTWSGRHTDNTHKALLINVEELKLKCVEHVPYIFYSSEPDKMKCEKCGKKIKLTAKWEVAE